MNGRMAATAGPAPGRAGSMPAAGTDPARGGQRPRARPWPLYSAVGPIGALPTAPGLARAFTAMVLGGWGMASADDLVQASELIVSELATNVVQLATDGDGSPVYQGRGLTLLWLGLMCDRIRLRIEVWDTLPDLAGVPVLRHPGRDQEHGRGLEIVNRLSLAWGWQPLPGRHAKCVWALLDVAQSGSPVARGREERR
jgi:hypothetical protein